MDSESTFKENTMNELARMIHDLVIGKPGTRTSLPPNLSPTERDALEDLRPLLESAPSELATTLEQTITAADWFDSPGIADALIQP
jgi:hypothetical protein